MSNEPPLTWIIGSGGLLGGAVARATARPSDPPLRVGVPWSDPDAAVAALGKTSGQLVRRGRPWRVAWCAGAGVLGTTAEQLAGEAQVLSGFLSALEAQLESQVDGRRLAGMFLASSAGGVYAGSAGTPFTEATTPRPISPYGEAKLRTEQLASEFANRTGTPLLIGRIANLYGPGQDLSKPQGLISQLCRAHLTRQPLSIYVPLDTGRDYLYVDDAARLVHAGLDWLGRVGGIHVKILASQRSTTVAAVLSELRRITKRRPEVVLGSSPLARFSARDLRFVSVVCPELDRCVRTTLATGVAATLESLGHELRLGRRSR